MKLAIMQPYLFPYIGYFQMINAAEKFVFYDDVNFIEYGWINRNDILLNGKSWKFSVPLYHMSSFALINATKIDRVNYERWLSKFLKTIEFNYKKAPFYKEVSELISTVLTPEVAMISELAKRSVTLSSSYIGIKTLFTDSSTIYNNSELKAKYRLFDICKKENAGTLICPIGGSSDLYHKEEFAEQNINLFFIKTHDHSYKQFYNTFVPNLSIIDVMMFNSPAEIRNLLEQYTLFDNGVYKPDDLPQNIHPQIVNTGKQKRILLLGGADIQISFIKKAMDLGQYVITCDYLPNNPGHKISNEYHNVSTTNKEAVLALAKKLNIDGISAYAADPAANTAAYVSEKLGIPGNSYSSVMRLSDKYSFRKAMVECGLNTPAFYEVNGVDDIIAALKTFPNGGIIKPVDTSGSKGIHKIEKLPDGTVNRKEITDFYKEATGYSRAKKIIFEEYILRKGFLMTGDFFIDSGKIIFYCFGDVHFNTRINGIVPRSISLPASKHPDFLASAIDDIQKIITYFKINTGVFNVDIIENADGKPVIIDIGARNGGNMFNDIIYYHTGIDLIEGSIYQCLGEKYAINYSGEILGYYAHNVLHSEKDGIFESIEFSPVLEKRIIYKFISPAPGDKVHKFINTSFRMGLLLLKFDSFDEMHDILGNIEKHVIVHLQKE